MNRDQMKGSWAKLRGKAKVVWADLTDDEALRAQGSADRLYGRIQQKFGNTKEVLKKKLDGVRMP